MKACFLKKVTALEITLKEGTHKFHLIKPFKLSAMVVITHRSYLMTAPTLQTDTPHVTETSHIQLVTILAAGDLTTEDSTDTRDLFSV